MGGLIRGYTRHLTPVSPAAARTDPLDRGLVGEWRFDPSTGLMLPDYSGYGHHGAVTGATWTTSERGPALSFGGVADYVQKDVQLVTAYPFTVNTWSKSTTVEAIIFFIGDKDVNNVYYTIEESSTGRAILLTRNTAHDPLDSGVQIDDDQWHMITGVWIHNTLREIYVDGVYGANQVDNYTYNTATDRYCIGRLARLAPAGYWNGEISDIRVYDRALSANEINALYQMGLKRGQPMTHVWMMPWGKAPPIVGAALPVLADQAIHSLVFGGVTVR